MRLIESSDPTEVPRAEARRLLCERLALASAVCHALEDSGGELVSETSRAPLSMLRSWVREHCPTDGPETLVGDGLQELQVPLEDNDLYLRLSAATSVCERLARLYTADNSREFREDSWGLEAALERWRRRTGELLPPPNRPERTKVQILALDWAAGLAEVADVVNQLVYGLPDSDAPPWLPDMDGMTGIWYLQAAGYLTQDQVTTLRKAYEIAVVAFLKEDQLLKRNRGYVRWHTQAKLAREKYLQALPEGEGILPLYEGELPPELTPRAKRKPPQDPPSGR